jgi:hypothetical protein
MTKDEPVRCVHDWSVPDVDTGWVRCSRCGELAGEEYGPKSSSPEESPQTPPYAASHAH